MRFRVFDMNRVRDDNYAADGSFWRAPVLNVRVADTQPAQWLSWSWVSVSPDDRYAVFLVEDVGAPGFDGADAGPVRDEPDDGRPALGRERLGPGGHLAPAAWPWAHRDAPELRDRAGALGREAAPRRCAVGDRYSPVQTPHSPA